MKRIEASATWPTSHLERMRLDETVEIYPVDDGSYHVTFHEDGVDISLMVQVFDDADIASFLHRRFRDDDQAGDMHRTDGAA